MSEERLVDENFEGSIFERMGFSKYLCPKCKAHLWKARDGSLICLNGCHLSPSALRLFESLIEQVAGGGDGEEQ
jgi:hypothetical protein